MHTVVYIKHTTDTFISFAFFPFLNLVFSFRLSYEPFFSVKNVNKIRRDVAALGGWLKRVVATRRRVRV